MLIRENLWLKFSVSPHPYPINLHLLREHCARVGTADKVSPNRNVENDKEWSLKLGRTIDSARDVRFRILNSIDVPPDRTSGTRNCERTEARRKRTRGIENSAKRHVVPTRIGPVDGAEVSERILALDFHDVDLAARGPADSCDAVTEHPESRPDSLPFRRVDACLDPRVDAKRLFALRFESSRCECVSTKIFSTRFDHQHSICYPRVLWSAGVVLKFVVAPTTAAEIEAPVR